MRTLLALAAVALPPCAAAALQVTSLYGSNMVLQRGSPGRLWGEASPGETVTLKATGAQRPGWLGGSGIAGSCVANATGHWRMTIPVPATEPPLGSVFGLELADSSTTLPVVNVTLGDVFLCSGQSNMELSLPPVYNGSDIIAAAHHPEIRLFKVPIVSVAEPLANANTTWVLTTPKTIAPFSAVCYLSALEWQRLHGHPGAYPMGLIEAAIGSTDIQSWMSPAQREAARTGCWAPPGEAPPAALPKSQSHNHPDHSPATYLYNGMINPVIGYTLHAVLWDQGENNAKYCTSREYACFWRSMVAGWRSDWGITAAAELPFAAVQIGSYIITNQTNANIRFAQTESLPHNCFDTQNATLALPVAVSAVAATYDLGSPQKGPQGWWIHCRNKTEVGRRLARALFHAAEGKAPEATGPVVTSVQRVIREDGRPTAVISFDRAVSIAPAQGCLQCCAMPNATWIEAHGTTFEVSNKKGHWLTATGAATGAAEITLTPVSNVTGPWLSGVRFGVQDVVQCVVYGPDGIPALPFSLEVGMDQKCAPY